MTKKVVNYTVVRRPTDDCLVWKVRDLIKDGYEPIGGIHTYKEGFFTRIYCQAMVKYEVCND